MFNKVHNLFVLLKFGIPRVSVQWNITVSSVHHMSNKIAGSEGD